MPLSIAMMVNEFPKVSETFVLNQIAGLIDRGHRLHIYPIQRVNGNEERQPLVDRYRLMDLMRRPPRLTESRAMAAIRAAGNLLTRPRRYDVVHAQFGPVGLHALRLLRRRDMSARWLVTCFRGYDISRYVRAHGDRVYDELWRRGDLFLTNSRYFHDRLLGMGAPPDRLFVNPSGIETDRFVFRHRVPAAGERLRIVGVGRLMPKKGFGFAIDAVAAAIRGGLDAQLAIIGEGNLRDELRDRISRHGVGDRVQLIGALPQDQVIRRLDEAHVFVAPSVTAPDGDQDGPTNTLKEAMAIGLPVLATRHGGITELVGDGLNGYLVDEHDTDALTDRLLRLAGEVDRWPQMADWGRQKVVRCYDVRRTNEHLADLYDAMINDRYEGCRSMFASDESAPAA